MSLPFRLSLIHILLLGTCICYPSQEGYNINGGYPLTDAESSNSRGVLAPYTPGHYNAEESSNTRHDSFDSSDQTQATSPQICVNVQGEPVPQANRMEELTLSTSTSPPSASKSSQSRTSFVTASNPLSEKYEQDNSCYGVQSSSADLMGGSRQNNIRFPTINHFKLFVESIKRSFLTPGGDVNMHFQTAMGAIKKNVIHNSEQTKEKLQTDNIPSSSKEQLAQQEVCSTQDQTGALKTESGQNDWGVINHMPNELSVSDHTISTQDLAYTCNYGSQSSGPGEQVAPDHMPSESLSVPDSTISTEELISTSDNRSQYSGLGKWSAINHVPSGGQSVPTSNYGSQHSGPGEWGVINHLPSEGQSVPDPTISTHLISANNYGSQSSGLGEWDDIGHMPSKSLPVPDPTIQNWVPTSQHSGPYEWEAISQMPSENQNVPNQNVPNPTVLTYDRVSPSDYGRKDLGPGPERDPAPNFVMEEPGLSHQKSSNNWGFSDGTLKDLTGNSNMQSTHFQPTSYTSTTPRPIMNRLFSTQDYSLGGHMNVPKVNTLTSPSEMSSSHSDEMPINFVPEQNIQQQKTAPHISKSIYFSSYGSLSNGFNKPGQPVQVQQLSNVAQPNYVPAVQDHSSFSSSSKSSTPTPSYGTRFRVYTQRKNFTIPSQFSDSMEKQTQSEQNRDPISEEPKEVDHQPTVPIPTSGGYSPSPEKVSLQNTGSYVGLKSVNAYSVIKGSESKQTFATSVTEPNVPIKQNTGLIPSSYESGFGRNDQQHEVSNVKQQVRLYAGFGFTVKASSSPQNDLSGQDDGHRPGDYLGDSRMDSAQPSTSVKLTDHNKPDFFIQNQARLSQRPQHVDYPTVQVSVSSDSESPSSGSSYASFSSRNDMATSFEPKKSTSNFVSNQGQVKFEQHYVVSQPSYSDSGSSTSSNEDVSSRFGTDPIVSNMLLTTSQAINILNVRHTADSFWNQNGDGNFQDHSDQISVSEITPIHPSMPPPPAKSQEVDNSMTDHDVFVQQHTESIIKHTAQLPASTTFDSKVGVHHERDAGYESLSRPTFSTAGYMPPLPIYAVRSRNRYVRRKMTYSKTRYTPGELTGDRAASNQQKRDNVRPKTKNTRSSGVKDHESWS